MKLLASLLTLLTSVSVVYAQDLTVAKNRDEAIASCKEKANASPEDLREKMLSSCQCVVNKTDFNQANELHKAGKTKELKSLYEQAAKSCQ